MFLLVCNILCRGDIVYALVSLSIVWEMHLLRTLLLLSIISLLRSCQARDIRPGAKKENGVLQAASASLRPAGPSYVPYWPYDRCSNKTSFTPLSDSERQRSIVEFNNMISTHQIGVSTHRVSYCVVDVRGCRFSLVLAHACRRSTSSTAVRTTFLREQSACWLLEPPLSKWG